MARFNKVFLIEDDPITVMVCERIMKMTDFATEVKSFANGHDAIIFFREMVESENIDAPDIIFLDINMPVMNGWDFLNEFSQLKAAEKLSPRIFILSSTVDPEDYKKASAYTAVEGFISKPLTKEHLNEVK
jgi:CheY-like chemotaxis protein